MTTPRSAPPASRHLYALDGLRTLAVAVVIMAHYAASHFHGGYTGVDLFFVLSGFLITRLLTQEFEDSGKIRFDLFYLRRVCRLMPATVVLLTFVTTMRFVMPNAFASPLSWWSSDLIVFFSLANYFCAPLNALGHCWSLSVEEQFYFLWPMTLVIILRRCNLIGTRIAIALALALVGAALRAWLHHHPGAGLDPYFFLFARMDTLLIGAALALAESLPNFGDSARQLCRFRLAEIAMAIFLIGVLCLKEKMMGLMYDGGMTITAIYCAVLIGASVYEPRQTLLKSFLESRPMVWLGRRSYGIYLYHLPIFYMLQPFHAKYSNAVGSLIYTGLGIGLPVVFAALSYHYVEMPFLKLKAHLKWNFPKRPATAAVVGNATV